VDGPLDEQDLAILSGVREVYQALDPMPPDLLDNIRFAISAQDVEVEVARMSADVLAVLTRGNGRQRMITFKGPSTTILLSVRRNDDDTARVDGWLIPSAAHHVEIRTLEGTSATDADDRGRFVLDHLPRVGSHLIVRTPFRSITTPTFEL
jgi:hypothetical protein